MCQWGQTEPVKVKITASLSHNGREYWKEMPIDSCIVPIVRALQAGGVDMLGSCCGHGAGPGIIDLVDGRTLVIIPSNGNCFSDKITPELWVKLEESVKQALVYRGSIDINFN